MPGDLRPSLKLLHTADLHLGDECYDRPTVRGALEGIIDTAITSGVDAMIIAGDLFDHSWPSDDDMDFVLSQLGLLTMPTVLLPGNHDALDESSIYHQLNLAERCPNVRLLRQPIGDLVRFPELKLTVWGKPVVNHLPEFRPIADMPPRDEEHWHIGVAHGLYLPDGEESERSSPIRAGEISSSGWDYIALGHIHSFLDVSQGNVAACYPGTPVQASRYPEGTGCVAIVHLDAELGVSIEQTAISQCCRT